MPEPSLKVIGTKTNVGGQQYITVTEAAVWPGTSTVKPRAGKAFVAVKITIEGITATSYDTKWFKVRDAAGKLYAGANRRAPNLYDNTLEAGKVTAGFVIFEVPKAVAAKLALEYKPPFVSTPTVVQLY
jgi:hypothetical protein